MADFRPALYADDYNGTLDQVLITLCDIFDLDIRLILKEPNIIIYRDISFNIYDVFNNKEILDIYAALIEIDKEINQCLYDSDIDLSMIIEAKKQLLFLQIQSLITVKIPVETVTDTDTKHPGKNFQKLHDKKLNILQKLTRLSRHISTSGDEPPPPGGSSALPPLPPPPEIPLGDGAAPVGPGDGAAPVGPGDGVAPVGPGDGVALPELSGGGRYKQHGGSYSDLQYTNNIKNKIINFKKLYIDLDKKYTDLQKQKQLDLVMYKINKYKFKYLNLKNNYYN